MIQRRSNQNQVDAGYVCSGLILPSKFSKSDGGHTGGATQHMICQQMASSITVDPHNLHPSTVIIMRARWNKVHRN